MPLLPSSCPCSSSPLLSPSHSFSFPLTAPLGRENDKSPLGRRKIQQPHWGEEKIQNLHWRVEKIQDPHRGEKIQHLHWGEEKIQNLHPPSVFNRSSYLVFISVIFWPRHMSPHFVFRIHRPEGESCLSWELSKERLGKKSLKGNIRHIGMWKKGS